MLLRLVPFGLSVSCHGLSGIAMMAVRCFALNCFIHPIEGTNLKPEQISKPRVFLQFADLFRVTMADFQN